MTKELFLSCLQDTLVLTNIRLTEIISINLVNIKRLKVDKNPMALRKSDLQKNGKFVEEHRLYRFWYEFLVLSPSYELARRYRTAKGRLSKADQARLPADFDRVLEIYDTFGNVQEFLFKTWWIDRAVELFGVSGAPTKTVPIYKFANGRNPDKDKVNAAVGRYLDSTRPKQNMPPAILLSIPINGTRQQVLREIKALLDEHIQKPDRPAKPLFELADKDVHAQNIIDAMSVLWIRAARPDWRLWQIGEECKIKKNREHRSEEPDAITEKRALEQMTSRKLKTAIYIAENAARGIFPSQAKPTHLVKFDPVEFSEILTRHNRWIKKEKARILAQPSSN